MPLRVKLSKKSLLGRLLSSRLTVIPLLLGVFLLVTCLGVFAYYYNYYGHLIDQKLAGGPFSNTSLLYAAPEMVSVGDDLSALELVSMLRRRGYNELRTNRLGWFNLRPNAVEIFPGSDSYFTREPAVVKFAGGQVSQIISLQDNTERTAYNLEPELVSNLFDSSRLKRRIVHFVDIPKVLLDAVLSAEDKRFFEHSGFDPLRIVKTAFTDIRERRLAQGASTLTMQLARYFWLDTKKTWERKAAEVIITIQLERRLTKQQIFEYYCNQVDLGYHRSFQIHGFGEGARVFFGKDIRELTLPEAALMVGVMPGPSLYNPYRHPDRAIRRRNFVLARMLDDGHIGKEQYDRALAAPLELAETPAEAQDASYFVDVVSDQLQGRMGNLDFKDGSYRIYTTIDMNLQRAALEAVRIGMQEVDKQLEGRRRRHPDLPEPQVALVALDAQTGEVKALVGGRNYGQSQLNRALAKRQPGSVFKPFVYAAALNTAFEEGARPITTVTQVLDEPTTFWFDNKPYEPTNFKDHFYGLVTVREAITKSLNIPTIKLAEMVGYDKVVDLARQAGMNLNIQPTPAVALGAYEVTPVEVAGAYTVFDNQGLYVKPSFIKRVVNSEGAAVYQNRAVTRPVLDPRVNYIMVDLLEGVLRNGTGAAVRSRGFLLPAAGKTGTSHDGWFAGFTSKLICAVWVGFDDNRELDLEGAHSALPVWTEFMKRAHAYRQYRGVQDFTAPEGVVRVDVDPASGELATPSCPETSNEPFIAGTEPVRVCHLHSSGRTRTQIAGWDVPEEPPGEAGAESESADGQAAPSRRASAVAPRRVRKEQVQAKRVENPPQKKSLLQRLRDIFR